MQTAERTERDVPSIAGSETQALKARVRQLGWLAAALAAALIILGGWLVYRSGGDDLTQTQEQMLETIDIYTEAWNDGDGAAAVAVMTPTAYFENLGNKYYVEDGRLERWVDSVQNFGFSVERIDEVETFIGNWVLVAEHRPVGDTTEQGSLYLMTPDGTQIRRHFAL